MFNIKKIFHKNLVSMDDICAVMCNYARPKNARSCVKRLKELGLQEIIVWNNGAKPIPEATHNIILSKNIGPIGKYYAGLETGKPYVLIIDDDYLLTESGLNALREWIFSFPAVAQYGNVFKPPFNKYSKKISYESNKIKAPQLVDIAMPSRGMLIKTEIYRRIPHHWAWGSLKVLSPGAFSTDLAMSCAIWDISRKHIAVVPAHPQGFMELEDESPDKALKHQKGVWKERSKVLVWLVEKGWEMLES